MDDLKVLTAEVGEVVESTGRMLKRKPPLTLDDLTDLQSTLKHCADALHHIKRATIIRHTA